MSKPFDSDVFTLSICFAAISIGYQNDRPIVRIACVDGSGLARGFLTFLHVAGRSCHVSGLSMRHRTRPLAIMLSADRVPVKSSRSKRLAHNGLSLSLGRLA